MRVNDLSTQPFPDPDDNLLWTVVCDVRLTWRRLAQIVPGGPPLLDIKVRQLGSEGPAIMRPAGRSVSAATAVVTNHP
jgi:hypothetical protein